ncbi:MAG: non-homologous end-joining DNA ligase [Actinomycetota bacterium]|nr:non-homologous end-joining DNA ligase [Actinomycetota bacterium]
MIRFGISEMPPEDGDHADWLDSLQARGHDAVELPFVSGFPWNEKRCGRFGELAADRGIAVSVHAPYFAVLTVEDPDKRVKTLAALEHTMKLGKALGAHTIVAHTGHMKDRDAEDLHELVAEGLTRIEPKVRHLGVALGLETAGTDRAFGSLGDIALIANRFSFVRPVIDWAHVHAKSGGGLTSREAFLSVISFLRGHFPGWAIDPLHTQFTDNEFGPRGEIRHLPYGAGSLRSDLLGEAAAASGLRMIVISEAHEEESHDLILADLRSGEGGVLPERTTGGRPLPAAPVDFPDEVIIEPDRDGFRTVALDRSVRISNPRKAFFWDQYDKGDLIQYYASIAPMLLPHLEGRALSMARYPDGADGDFFYEKQCPSHAPEWLIRAPIHSSHRGEPIEFCTAPDLESLIWVANMGCIEMHPWLSRAERHESPDFAVFDLDPQEGVTWEQVTYTAGLIKVILDKLGLDSYAKTSGATGLHIYVPVEPIYDYARVRRLVESVGKFIVVADPEVVTMEWDIARRGARVFIDHNQNVGGKTIASVYSVRPRPGAPVSTPILWEELDTVRPDDFTIATIWPRLRQYGDLFAPVLRGRQTLEVAESLLGLG